VTPTGMLIVIPSRLGVGEVFSIKLKLRGPVRKIPCAGVWNTRKPELHGPFNLNVQRQIQFMDDCLPEWAGRLRVDGAGGLEGPAELVFDGKSQGVFASDTRPIKQFGGFRWSRPGFHFIRLTDTKSGLEVWSNPVYVTERPPAMRLYWGDPHWQTFFSDGIRCPEELYAFARDESFLEFGAISDHMEAVTDRQWDYFQAVTNDYNAPGRFVTLIGQEWTNHNPKVGAPGHRNIYYRGNGGPALRSTDPDCNTLEKLWVKLDSLAALDPIAIPHHSANVIMGVDWEQGWNARYEKAVEIYSVWGSSEKPAAQGNTRPIRDLDGEASGRHVIDALKRGYRFGFVGGGDIHDGRPGDELHNESYPPGDVHYPQGFTAVFAPQLARDDIYEAIKQRRTYATTKRRIYLDVGVDGARRDRSAHIRAAAEDGIRTVELVRNGEDADLLWPGDEARIVEGEMAVRNMASDEFAYIRLTTEAGHLAWSSPFWGNGE